MPLTKEEQRIANPLREEQSTLRTSLLPGVNYIRWVYMGDIYSDIYQLNVAPNQAPGVHIEQPAPGGTVGKVIQVSLGL